MCGIVGFWSATPAENPQPMLSDMLNAISHRGPDHAGILSSQHVGVGCARLAIIDLKTGNQPIVSADGKLVLVCNGEILNYVELRAQLIAKGARFTTASDVEVISHLYREDPRGFVEKLNGQFAFALIDRERNVVLLGRDRSGICPLFYYFDGARLLFASEIKALFRSGLVTPRLSAEGVSQAIHFWAVVPPQTCFEGVSQLPPGHLLELRDGRIDTRPYWRLSFPTEQRGSGVETEACYAARIRDTMRASVDRALRADVPVGLYLSGGVDSSILAGLVHKARGPQFKTFSVSFEDETFDETAYQDVMIAKIGARHTRIKVTNRQVGEAFERVVYHAETPLFRTAPAPLFALSEQVRSEGFKVVLSGEGADEVFWGYDTFREAFIRLLWSRVPDSKWRPQLLQKIFPYFEQYANPRNFDFLKAFYRRSLAPVDHPFYALLPRWQNNQGLLDLLDPDFASGIKSPEAQQATLGDALGPGFGDGDVYQRYQSVEMLSLLAGYLLSSQGDRMLMAHSVEGRFPFLDNEVIDLAASMPGRLKCRGLKDKYLLRRAFREELPEEIFTRPKFAYRAPDLRSFFHAGKPLPYVAEMLSASYTRKVGAFRPERVEKLCKKACADTARPTSKDNMAIVLVLSTHLLHHQFVEKNRLQ